MIVIANSGPLIVLGRIIDDDALLADFFFFFLDGSGGILYDIYEHILRECS